MSKNRNIEQQLNFAHRTGAPHSGEKAICRHHVQVFHLWKSLQAHFTAVIMSMLNNPMHCFDSKTKLGKLLPA